MTNETKTYDIDKEKLLAYGFITTNNVYTIEIPLTAKPLVLKLTIDRFNNIRKDVYDNISKETYDPYHNKQMQGEYVQKVREETEQILQKILNACATKQLFSSMQASRIATYIEQTYNVKIEFPWQDDTYRNSGIFRNPTSNKWFALIMQVSKAKLDDNESDEIIHILNVKKDPTINIEPTKQKGIYPAYHMHHKLWISIALDETLPDATITDYIDTSYRLTTKTKRIKQ